MMTDTELANRAYTHLKLLMSSKSSLDTQLPSQAGVYVAVFKMVPFLRDDKNEVLPSDRQPPFMAIGNYDGDTMSLTAGQLTEVACWIPLKEAEQCLASN